MKPLEVHLGRGLGPLLFGMSMREARALMGESPDEEREEDGTYHLEYSYRGTALFFHADEDYRLSGIEVDPLSGALLFGEEVFLKDRREIADLLKSELPGVDSYIGSIVHLEPFGTRMTIGSLALDLYFDTANRLTELHWGPFLTAAGDVIWPEPSHAVG